VEGDGFFYGTMAAGALSLLPSSSAAVRRSHQVRSQVWALPAQLPLHLRRRRLPLSAGELGGGLGEPLCGGFLRELLRGGAVLAALLESAEKK